MIKWYDRIGNTIEMRVGNKWVKGIIIDGYKTHAGAVNMETLSGRKYWCYVAFEDLQFRKCIDSDGDLITNADRIRAMSDEELAEKMMTHVNHEIIDIVPFCKNLIECQEKLNAGEVIPDEICKKCLSEWLQSESEEQE